MMGLIMKMNLRCFVMCKLFMYYCDVMNVRVNVYYIIVCIFVFKFVIIL